MHIMYFYEIEPMIKVQDKGQNNALINCSCHLIDREKNKNLFPINSWCVVREACQIIPLG